MTATMLSDLGVDIVESVEVLLEEATTALHELGDGLDPLGDVISSVHLAILHIGAASDELEKAKGNV